MPVWLSVTSFSFCAQTVGNPVTAVEAAMAAPLLRTERREILAPGERRAVLVHLYLP